MILKDSSNHENSDSLDQDALTSQSETRPKLERGLAPTELRRWYWKGCELADFARELGISTRGPKESLIARLTATLSNKPLPQESKPRTQTNKLEEPLSLSTLIPPNQSCTQLVREFMKEQIGASFSFDKPMREFFHESDGTRTLNDAVTHWKETRSRGKEPIEAQFELNNFTRAWYKANPGGKRTELLAAWEAYKALPREKRKP